MVGWSIKDRPNRELVGGAVLLAIERRKPKPTTTHHSKQGVVYRAGSYFKLLQCREIIRSMSGKGNCYDNADVESIFSSLKNELVHHRDDDTRQLA